MNKKAIVALLLLTVFIAACGAPIPIEHTDVEDVLTTDLEGIPNESANLLAGCESGVTKVVLDYSGRTAQGDYAFLIVPNAGCELPIQYCIFEGTGYGAGLQCMPIEDLGQE